MQADLDQTAWFYRITAPKRLPLSTDLQLADLLVELIEITLDRLIFVLCAEARIIAKQQKL